MGRLLFFDKIEALRFDCSTAVNRSGRMEIAENVNKDTLRCHNEEPKYIGDDRFINIRLSLSRKIPCIGFEFTKRLNNSVMLKGGISFAKTLLFHMLRLIAGWASVT